MRSTVLIAAIAAGCVCGVAAKAQLATLSTSLVTGGLVQPVAMIPDPRPGANFFYIVQQNGVIRVLQGSTLAPTAFANLGASTAFPGAQNLISTGSERGLLGMAFDPNFATTGRVFFNFTTNGVPAANPPGSPNPPFGATIIARYTVNNPGDVALPLSLNVATRFDMNFGADLGQNVRWIAQDFSNHNGGTINFGPDGFLYIGMGDGGSAGDPNNRAQTVSSHLGKFLRIDTAVPDANADGYLIPASNPFLAANLPPALAGFSARPQIWSFGQRNPWKHSFDNLGWGATNEFMMADVGQNAWEEVNREAPGAGGGNYGWRRFEGNALFSAGTSLAYDVAATNYVNRFPVHVYSHSVGISITGGFVYRGAQMCSFRGRYFFADYGSGRVWTMNRDGSNVVEHTTQLWGPTFRPLVSSFGRAPNGELFILRYSSTTGEIYRVTSNDTPLTGDVNGDGRVNFDDLNVVLSGFGGQFGFNDLNNVLSGFGNFCGVP